MRNNPLLGEDILNADVEARVFDDTIYLYGTTKGNFDNQYLNQFHVYSSQDMETFVDNGISFSIDDVKWADPELGLWAPDCVCKHGKYYLYYCLSNGDCGVAVSNSPAGKFKDLGKIADVSGIDPAVLVDGDDYYLYWGQYDDISVAKLKENMTEIDVDSIAHPLTVKEHGYHEGISARKIGNLYYLVYTDTHRHHHMPVCQGYSVSDNPFGGFKYKGVLIDNFGCDPKTWNNHGSIECFMGQWYLFYHCAFNNNSRERRLFVEKMELDENGGFAEAVVTTSGSNESLPANIVIPASSAVYVDGGCYIGASKFEECKLALCNIQQFSRAKYRYLDFQGENRVKLLASFPQNGRVELYIDSHYFDCVSFEPSDSPAVISKKISSIFGKHELEFRFFGSEGWLQQIPLIEGCLYQFSFSKDKE